MNIPHIPRVCLAGIKIMEQETMKVLFESPIVHVAMDYAESPNNNQIEDVGYEELVPDPDDSPAPVLEVVSSQEMYAQPKILKRIPPIVSPTTCKYPNI